MLLRTVSPVQCDPHTRSLAQCSACYYGQSRQSNATPTLAAWCSVLRVITDSLASPTRSPHSQPGAVFCMSLRTVSPVQRDPHTRSLAQSPHFLDHITSFVSLDQMLRKFVIPFITILVSFVVPYTLPDILSPTNSPVRNFEGCLAVSK